MAKFNKAQVLQSFINKLEEELHLLEQNLKEMREETTHEESKPENEYDTRAIESGYLVKAQSKRLLDAKEALSSFKHIELKDFGPQSPIKASALVEVEHEAKKIWFFYMPFGGGFSITQNGQKIQVITPSSPLGESMLNLKVGDYAIVESVNDVKEYEILSVE